MQPGNLLKRIFNFYYQGFTEMTWGRKLWIIILLKLFVMFVVLKTFFFPDLLKKNFSSDKERSEYVIDQLTKPIK